MGFSFPVHAFILNAFLRGLRSDLLFQPVQALE
jgi:hypothetical protein